MARHDRKRLVRFARNLHRICVYVGRGEPPLTSARTHLALKSSAKRWPGRTATTAERSRSAGNGRARMARTDSGAARARKTELGSASRRPVRCAEPSHSWDVRLHVRTSAIATRRRVNQLRNPPCRSHIRVCGSSVWVGARHTTGACVTDERQAHGLRRHPQHDSHRLAHHLLGKARLGDNRI